jgi:TPP-dependent pyruvate/acetoin dehydrogenase alpha subunit
MLDEGWALQSEIDEVHAAIGREVDDAVAWAEQSPYPGADTLLDDVYENQ